MATKRFIPDHHVKISMPKIVKLPEAGEVLISGEVESNHILNDVTAVPTHRSKIRMPAEAGRDPKI